MIDLKARIKWWIAVSLSAMAVLALFSRSVAFSYIGIDDAAYTFRNPFVASGFSLDNVVEAFANLRHGGIWMPITYISYMVDFSICKMSGIPLMQMLHLTNVLLHAVNFCLLIRFMRGLCVPSSVRPFSAMAGGTHDGEGAVATQDFGRAMHGGDTQMVQSPNGQMQSEIANRKIANRKFLLLIVFAALIWAIHPLRVEPVAWVAARKELLWTMFALLGLLSWMRFCGPGSRALGQPSDSTATTTRASSPRQGFGCAGARPSRVTHDGEGAVATQGFGRAGARPSRATHGGDTQMTKSTNGQMQSEIANRKIVNSPEQSEIVNHQSKIKDALIFSILWFATGLLPTLGIFGGFGIEAHADRFAYLPSMAIPFLCAALLAVGVGDFGGVAGRSDADGLSPSGIAVKWALPAAVLALAAVTFRQLGFWRDDATAYHRVLVCDPEHPRAMVHVADSLCSRRRDFAGGIAMYRKSLSLADTVPDGGINVADVRARLAYALASRGGYDDFGEVKRLGADVLKDVRLDRRGMMLDALGTAFMQEGDYRLAAMLFEASLKAPDRFWPKASTQRKLDVCKGGF